MDTKGEGDPADRPNAPAGSLSREDLFNKSDEEREQNEDFTDVQSEDYDKLAEVPEDASKTESKGVPEKKEKKYALKVNGKDLELTEEEMIAHVQKGLAAEERFQEAARLKREAEALKTQPPKEDVAKPEVGEDDLALARALQMGSEEEAAKVIKKLRAPTLNEGDVVRKIDERLTFQSSVERFKTEYQDIFNDPYLSQLVAMKDEQLVKSGDTRAYYDRYKAIGDEIRAWAGKMKPEEKKERKASITVLKTASGRAAEKEEEDEDQSASDTINSMAKARGQTYAK
jgi:hypothetical protein